MKSVYLISTVEFSKNKLPPFWLPVFDSKNSVSKVALLREITIAPPILAVFSLNVDVFTKKFGRLVVLIDPPFSA